MPLPHMPSLKRNDGLVQCSCNKCDAEQEEWQR